MPHFIAVRLHQANREVLPLDRVPLEIHHLGHAVAEGIGHNQDAGRQRQPGHGENGLHRLALEIPHGNPERVGKEVRDARALDQCRAVARRRLGAHRLGGRKSRRAPHCPKHARRRGARAHQERQWKGGVVQAELQCREAEEPVIHHDQLVSKEDASAATQHGRRRHHHKGELQVVHYHLAVGEPKRLQDGNLFPLQRQ